MIAGLIGSVAHVERDAVVLDVNGVLYRVYVPMSVIQDDDAAVGQRMRLDTHLIVREDSLTLYGFLGVADVEWFRTLLTINGVGPRAALAMMSRFGAEELAEIVHREDVTLLATVPGIGRKTASRILLDLKGKVPEPTGGALSGQVRMADDDLIEALEGLGYSRAEAVGAASKVDLAANETLQDRLLAALREVGPGG